MTEVVIGVKNKSYTAATFRELYTGGEIMYSSWH